MGDKGAGKSTLAAKLLLEADARLVTDDLLAINDDAEVLPAFAGMKLSPESFAHVEGLKATLRPPPVEGFPKHRLQIDLPPSPDPQIPRALFEICRSKEARIEELPFDLAIRTLLKFSYFSRFGAREIPVEERSRVFQQAARLANMGIVKRLCVPDSLERLDEVCRVLRAYSRA
jgi:hypothetical protein